MCKIRLDYSRIKGFTSPSPIHSRKALSNLTWLQLSKETVSFLNFKSMLGGISSSMVDRKSREPFFWVALSFLEIDFVDSVERDFMVSITSCME